MSLCQTYSGKSNSVIQRCQERLVPNKHRHIIQNMGQIVHTGSNFSHIYSIRIAVSCDYYLACIGQHNDKAHEPVLKRCGIINTLTIGSREWGGVVLLSFTGAWQWWIVNKHYLQSIKIQVFYYQVYADRLIIRSLCVPSYLSVTECFCRLLQILQATIKYDCQKNTDEVETMVMSNVRSEVWIIWIFNWSYSTFILISNYICK